MNLMTKPSAFPAILCIMLVWGCTQKSQPQQPTELTYLALGDSYTIGEAVPEQERWPVQLVDSLQKAGIDVKAPTIIAKTGWTTNELMEAIDQAAVDSTYDFVSLLIGVNNQYRGYDINQYRVEFQSLLEQALAFANNRSERVIVVSIPNYGVTPFAQSRNPERIGKELTTYDTIADSISGQYDVAFINIRNLSENARSDSSLLAQDQLHPSGKMYAQWVSRMLPIVTSKLK
ncbi:MAG: SGNH/GDSL hydrolase family protein [Bacteroidota bacterium]